MKSLLAASFLLLLVGCGGAPGVVTLDIDPSSTTVTQGHTARFTVTVSGTTNHAVTWEATGGQLVSKGTAATFIALETGTFDVTATSQANPSVAATATITVAAVPGEAHIEFVTDGSVVVAGTGHTAQIEAVVIDADGSVIETGSIDWSSSDPAIVSVAADGVRSATLTTESAATSQVHITATYDDLSATMSVLVTKPSVDTVLIDSSLVLHKTSSTVTLERTTSTESLTPGQRLVSGSLAGVLAEITSVAVTATTVDVETVPTSLAAAFDEFSFAGEVAPTEVTVQLVPGGKAVVTTNGHGDGITPLTIVDDVTCTSDGGPAPIDLAGADITVTATIFGELSFSVLLGDDQFRASFGTDVQVAATTGSVAFSGQVSGAVVCALELPRIGLAPLSAGVITLWTGFVPILGVELIAGGAASTFTVSGPHGGVAALLEGGIEYDEGSGWSPIATVDFNADFEPFSTTMSLDQPFAARLAPFGRVDIGLSLDLGVDALSVPIIDARFVELKGFGYLDLALPDPVAVENTAYSGPEWSLGVGVRGALKADFQGLLPDLLEVLGIDVDFAGQLELFEEQAELLTNPSLTFLATPAVVEIPLDGSAPVTLTAFTSDDASGTVSFWASKDGASSLTFLTSAALEGGTGSTTWHVTEEGEYDLYARMSIDAASLVKPYAANSTASVSVTEEDEEEEDTGPLGNEGPFGGRYTHFSLGQCDGVGVGLTIDFVEQPNGQLTGTYVGHYCSDGCFDLETYPSGPVTGTLSGTRSGAEVVFALSAPVGGLFTGERWVPVAPPGSASLAVIDGFAEGVLPCEDEYGTFNSGFFSFVGTESIWF